MMSVRQLDGLATTLITVLNLDSIGACWFQIMYIFKYD
jgi:hypothetical protein